VRASYPQIRGWSALKIGPHRDKQPRAATLAAATVLVVAWCALAYLIASGGGSLTAAVGLAVTPAVLVFVAIEFGDARGVDASSRLSLAVVLGLPLLMVFVQGNRATLEAQALFALLVGLLFANLQSERRAEWLKLAGPTCLLGGLLGLALVVSYVASGVSGASEAGPLASLLMASAFFVMPALIVDRPGKVEWVVALLLVASMLQVAVVTAQASGLTAGLPGPLSVLDIARWHDPSSVLAGGEGAGRFHGTFGDYELLAEYASLVTVLGVGLSIVSRRRSLRVLGVLCSVGAVVTGVFTATRAYPLAVAIGLSVLMLLLLTDRVRGRAASVVRVGAVAVLLIAAVYAVVPDNVREIMLGRFAALEVTGPNVFNRGAMFDAWLRLATRMPPLGYGAQMLRTIQAGYTDVVVTSPHSLYFWVLLTAGIPGLAALIAAIGSHLFAQVKAYRSGADLPHAWSGVFLAVFAAWLANEYKIDCVRSPLYVDWLMFLWGTPLALSAASRLHDDALERSEEAP
jgi:O-antigen ligase